MLSEKIYGRFDGSEGLNDLPGLEHPTAEALAYYIAHRILGAPFLPPYCSISVRVSEGMNNVAATPFLKNTFLTKNGTALLTENPYEERLR